MDGNTNRKEELNMKTKWDEITECLQNNGFKIEEDDFNKESVQLKFVIIKGSDAEEFISIKNKSLFFNTFKDYVDNFEIDEAMLHFLETYSYRDQINIPTSLIGMVTSYERYVIIINKVLKEVEGIIGKRPMIENILKKIGSEIPYDDDLSLTIEGQEKLESLKEIMYEIMNIGFDNFLNEIGIEKE